MQPPAQGALGPGQAGRGRYRDPAAHWRSYLPGYGARRSAPSVEDVRRRLGLRHELDASETFGEAWTASLASRRKARDSYANTLEQHGRNWLLPSSPTSRSTG